MKPWLKWTLVGLALALLAAGIGRTLMARTAKQQALQAQQTALQAQVTIELRPGDLITAEPADLPLNLPISGTVQALNTAVIKARVAGELQGLSVREGDAVAAGQVLGRIDPADAETRLRQARQQAQASRAQVDIAQRNHDNNLALVAQGFISSTALASSQANLAAAQATYAAALSTADLAAKGLSDTVLKSPLRGRVAQRLAQNGERLGVDARVLEIIDPDHLELRAELSPAQALRVQPGQLAQLELPGAADSVRINARVVRISPSASAGSRAIAVYLGIAPGSPLRHGLFVEGLLHIGDQKVLALPLSAVRTDKPEPYVQVLAQQAVQHVPVTPGVRTEVQGQTLVAVTGLSAGSQVIAGALGVLREGTPVRLIRPQPGAN